MKIKRNKRVEQNLRIRAARSAGKDYLPAISLRRLRASLGMARRKPKAFITLLEQDIAAQAERLRRLENTVSLVGEQPELVLVPAADVSDELPVERPEPEALPASADGRTNYQYVRSSQRVRRRIIL